MIASVLGSLSLPKHYRKSIDPARTVRTKVRRMPESQGAAVAESEARRLGAQLASRPMKSRAHEHRLDRLAPGKIDHRDPGLVPPGSDDDRKPRSRESWESEVLAQGERD